MTYTEITLDFYREFLDFTEGLFLFYSAERETSYYDILMSIKAENPIKDLMDAVSSEAVEARRDAEVAGIADEALRQQKKDEHEEDRFIKMCESVTRTFNQLRGGLDLELRTKTASGVKKDENNYESLCYAALTIKSWFEPYQGKEIRNHPKLIMHLIDLTQALLDLFSEKLCEIVQIKVNHNVVKRNQLESARRKKASEDAKKARSQARVRIWQVNFDATKGSGSAFLLGGDGRESSSVSDQATSDGLNFFDPLPKERIRKPTTPKGDELTEILPENQESQSAKPHSRRCCLVM